MQLIRAFVTKTDRITNAAGAVASAFELSPMALTYSKERGEYTHPDYVGDTVHTFRVANVETGSADVMTSAQVREILRVANITNTYFQTHQYPYDLADFVNTVTAFTDGTLGMFQHGALVATGDFPIVEWISWDSLSNGSNDIRVWLTTESFEAQFTEYEIVVIPPVDDLDRFFGAYGGFAAELAAQKIEYHISRAMDARDGHPETFLRFNHYGYVNVNNTSQVTPSTWGVLIYGSGGDTIDSIKDAIVQYVLANSSHTESEWIQVLPDLFKRTEFLFIPRWDTVAIPNLTEASALYRSMQDPKESIEKAKVWWNNVDSTFVESNLTILPINYKGLSLLGLNGQNNVDESKTLMQIFPDYLPVPTSSPDFGRMTVSTRNWLLALQEAVVAAETANAYSSLEGSLRKTTRNNILYVTVFYENVNYLVAARSNTLPTSAEVPL